MRTPILTRVSDGYPRRRLLIGSKAGFVVGLMAHGAPPKRKGLGSVLVTPTEPEGSLKADEIAVSLSRLAEQYLHSQFCPHSLLVGRLVFAIWLKINERQ